MLSVFVNEYLGTAIVGATVFLILGALTVSLFKNRARAKREGGCSCGCGCSGCPMKNKCHTEDNSTK